MAQGRTKFLYPSGSTPLEGYTLKRGIGIGGFGEVYFALSDAGKEVALKRIQRNLDIELRGVRQCLNLKHVNLISLWDIRTNEAGESWVVMEYVPGKSLREMLELYPEGLPEDQVKIWLASTAAGVTYLHDHGIVHRDLKPGNIFCDEDEQVIKIGDYGLSKFISCSRRSGQTESVGTFHYMAPEIGKGVYGKEIDIYALGIILFEMLTGRVPFDGESSQEIMMKHLTADPDLTGLPEEFVAPITKCLVKDPDERYSNVPELLADLPWKDIAQNSHNIVTRHSIGPMGAAPKVNLVDARSDAREVPTVQPMLIRHEFNKKSEDIVFGELRDTSPGERNGQTIVPVVNEVEIVSQSAATSPGGPNEPIARVLHLGAQNVGAWWNGNTWPTPLKIFALVLSGVVVVLNAKMILPIGLGLGLCYLVYYLVRSWMDKPDHVVEEGLRKTKAEIKQEELGRLRAHLAMKDFGDRSAELLGSVLISTVAAIFVCSLGLLVGGVAMKPSIETQAEFVWMTLTSCIACWSMLSFSKFWEHRNGDSWLRRVAMAGIGLGVGVFAYFIGSVLGIDFGALRSQASYIGNEALPHFSMPLLPAYLMFFTVLFGILRWWKQADPTRGTRLNLWAVGLGLVWAVVFSHLLGFEPVRNGIIAIAVSVAMQIAAPWLNPQVRQTIHRSNLA
jgi:serine/threonine protein kinase